MITIEISEETATNQDMVYALQHIIKLIDRGFTSGYAPTWTLSGDEEIPEIDND